MQQLTVKQLKNSLSNDPSLVLLDVREPWEFEICHIEGSKNIEMSKILSSLSEFNPQNMIVVICHHGTRSFQVANYLESEGFENVVNLEGGVDSWARSIDQSMPTY